VHDKGWHPGGCIEDDGAAARIMASSLYSENIADIATTRGNVGGFVGTVTWGTDLASPATLTWTGCLNEHGAAPPDPITQARDGLLT
jgi:hypothetical protein